MEGRPISRLPACGVSEEIASDRTEETVPGQCRQYPASLHMPWPERQMVRIVIWRCILSGRRFPSYEKGGLECGHPRWHSYSR